MTETDATLRDGTERRASTTERRRYNRRGAESAQVSPPYYEIFERIATALEGIEHALATTTVVLPPEGSRQTPTPRRPTTGR